MIRLLHMWNSLRASFWFVPSLLVAGHVILATVLVQIAHYELYEWAERWPRLFGGGSEGARGMLSAIASSMMAVLSVTFSMTMVTLTLAASQYTSRILRIFMSSRLTQSALGMFAGAFSYSLIVLRTIRADNEFVPQLAIFVGFMLALVSVFVLIGFIHHIAYSIQASTILATVMQDTLDATAHMLPTHLDGSKRPLPTEEASLDLQQRSWLPIPAARSGYIQGIDYARLAEIGREHGTIVRVPQHGGDFAIRDTPLAYVALLTPVPPEVCESVQHAFSLSRHRTVEQDVGFGIRQLVDVAIKALSPGVNDTTTAVMAVDYLTAILCDLVTREFPPGHEYRDGRLVLLARRPTFEEMVGNAFDQIRMNSHGNLAVLLRILTGLSTVAGQAPVVERLRTLTEHADRVAEVGARTLESPFEHQRLTERLEEVRQMLAERAIRLSAEGEPELQNLHT